MYKIVHKEMQRSLHKKAGMLMFLDEEWEEGKLLTFSTKEEAIKLLLPKLLSDSNIEIIEVETSYPHDEVFCEC